MNERIQDLYAALCWLAFAIACQAFAVDLFARAWYLVKESEHQAQALKLLVLTGIVQLIVAPFLFAALINFCIPLFRRPVPPVVSPHHIRGSQTLRGLIFLLLALLAASALLILAFVYSRNNFLSPFVTGAFRTAVVVTIPLPIYIMVVVTRTFLSARKQNAERTNL